MKKTIRLLFYFLLGCFTLYGSVKAYNFLTDGFNPGDLNSEFAFRENLSFPVDSPEKIKAINAILHQKFSYLGKGVQTYALLSEDQRYVLKIVRQKKAHRFNALEKAFFQLPFTQNWKDAKIQKKRNSLQYYLSSFLLCYQELPEESHLLYLHLLPTHDVHQKIVIADKLGFTHEIDLDKIDFMLQEKAETLEATIRPFVEKGDYAGVKQSLQKVIDLLTSCCKKGVIDNDLAMHANIGFINGQAMFMDVGQLVKKEKAKDTESAFYRKYIGIRLHALNEWACSKFPELDPEKLV